MPTRVIQISSQIAFIAWPISKIPFFNQLRHDRSDHPRANAIAEQNVHDIPEVPQKMEAWHLKPRRESMCWALGDVCVVVDASVFPRRMLPKVREMIVAPHLSRPITFRYFIAVVIPWEIV